MPEPGLASYVYCIVRAGERPSFEGLSGVDSEFGVDVITQGRLGAVTSRVRLEEFSAEALKRNLEDLGWLERTARAHDAVLGRALASKAVVPLRLCTIFSDEGHVREMLERERERLLEALERLSGRAEWSVKLLADPEAIERVPAERDPAPAASPGAEPEAPGREFFARKRRDQALREETRAALEGAAEETHARLEREAVASALLPPQHPDVSRRSGEMVLNGAYLVERSRAAAFQAVAGELRERHRPAGLELELTGPWAPYNFVDEPR